MNTSTIFIALAALGLMNCSKSEFSSGAAGFKKAQLATDDPTEGPDDDDALKGGSGVSGEDETYGKNGGKIGSDDPVTAAIIPSSACAAQAPNTTKTADGFIEFNSPDFKPGLFGQASAIEGMAWPNGGTNRPWGDATATIDWNVCSKLAFKEKGHSLTRTILFKDPPSDAELHLRVHRYRATNESQGVGIWYHFDKRVTWTGPALHNFHAIKDYNIKCQFTAANSRYVCQYTTSNLSAVDCTGMTRPVVTCTTLPAAQ
jgi:hypothetical protein